jgi:hypothetical protein
VKDNRRPQAIYQEFFKNSGRLPIFSNGGVPRNAAIIQAWPTSTKKLISPSRFHGRPRLTPSGFGSKTST